MIIDNQRITDSFSSARTLMISFIGMKTVEVQIKANLTVVLHSDSEVLDEVIVTAYGTSTKGTFTGSAAVMKADKIEKRQVSNVSQALAGAVAGVQTQSNNGQPGTSATVRIRGVGSINADSDPLYVIDGIPFDGDLSSINTADIESMTVLKDAASTALYGARGANGIIMITTKNGNQGKAVVSLDAKWGVNSRQIKTYDVLTSTQNYLEKEYQAIYNSAIYQLGYSPVDATKWANAQIVTKDNGGNGYQIYTVPEGELMFGTNGKLNPNATLGYSNGDYYYTADNWADEMFKNKLRQQYDLSINGGNERGTYYISMGYLDDQGVIDGSGFTRYSSRFKGNYQVNKWLKVGANMAYNYSNSQYPGEQTSTSSSGNAFYLANSIAPIYPIYVRNTDGSLKYENDKLMYDYGRSTDAGRNRTFMSISNPAADLIYNKTEYLMDIFNGNWYATIAPIDGLTLTARYGLSVDNTRYNNLGNAYMGQSASYGGTAYQAHNRTYGFDQQYVANYTKTFKDVHAVDVTLGYEGYKYEYAEVSASGQNLYNPESYYVGNAIDQLMGSGYKNEYSTAGVFARVNYAYNEKYIGNVSFRRDASSRFHPDNRWGNFWSGSFAWVITKENFMNNITWLDMLKFKASYGQQGNDAVGNYYAYLDQYTMTGANGVFSDGTLSYKGNPDLTWETSISYNVGFDFAMFNNRLNGTIEYFGRKSSDMLYYKPVAGSNGYTQMPMNIGSMTNSGLEIDLGYDIISNKNITWNVNANATFIKNKINELHPDLNGELIDGTRIYSEGESMYRMYLVEWAGVNPENGVAMYWATDENGERYKTEAYSTAQQSKVATDDLLPTVYGGFGTTFSAYGFDASIQLSYQLGGHIYDSGYAALMHTSTSYSAGTNWHKDIEKAWTPENTNTDVPRLCSTDNYANSTSTRFITSSDYLSLNNITIGYTLPSNVVRKLGLTKLRVFFAGDNLALLSARKGLDPRQSYTTATTARYTALRTVSGGFNLSF